MKTYRRSRALSSSAFDDARSILAGGVDSPVRAGAPMGGPPPVIDRALGSRIFDVDGNEYIDYLCAYGPVLLGHAYPAIAAAVRKASLSGAVVGGTHPDEVRLARRISTLIPSMERLRFVSTGTEACMSAIRVARGFTRREKVVRFAGNYHGHADEMIFSAGASSNSAPTIDSGVTEAATQNVFTLPYDDLVAIERCLQANGSDIAAIILEPICANMGLVVPSDGYLAGVREQATRSGALLIFDEVITGFRLGPGGAQSIAGVIPDLTCIGKTLGGGLPIAAYGGRADVMDVLAPAGGVFQGGTFSGNPLCTAAANAFLDRLEEEPLLHARLERLGARLANGIKETLGSLGLEYPVVQCGSIVDFMFRTGEPHRTLSQAREADTTAYARFYWAILDEGIFLAPSPMEVMFVTASHTEEDIDATIAAIHRALAR